MIPDSHIPLCGLHPVLFSFHGYQITSYAALIVLGIVVAILYHSYLCRAIGQSTKHSRAILISALFFGSLGAKIFSILMNIERFQNFTIGQFLYSGRTILGGLIGGWIGVVLIKKLLGIQTRMGNTIAPAAALGISIGRLGCFLGSCCYGKPTSLPVGIDFGDGILRHPTQLYDSLFSLMLFLWLSHQNRTNPPPGLLFKKFILAYCLFRFVLEFLRIEPVWFLGMTIFQCFSLFIMIAIVIRVATLPRDPYRPHEEPGKCRI